MAFSVVSRPDLTHSITTAAAALALSLVAFSAQADYTSFSFSPEKPYYFEDGKVDFGTYNGFRRYHAECHVCHGPAGLGSSYAPALIESVNALSYQEFIQTIVAGRRGRDQSVMPSFADNMNVLPYMNDIYAYLRARADGVIGMARPDKFPRVKTPN